MRMRTAQKRAFAFPISHQFREIFAQSHIIIEWIHPTVETMNTITMRRLVPVMHSIHSGCLQRTAYMAVRYLSATNSSSPAPSLKSRRIRPKASGAPQVQKVAKVSSRQEFVARPQSVRNDASTHASPKHRPTASGPVHDRVTNERRPAQDVMSKSKALSWPKKAVPIVQASKVAPRRVPTSLWLEITDIPPMSALDDMLRSLQNVLTKEYERGIVDLDAPCDSDSKDEPLLQLDLSSGDWVKSAHLVLSSRCRPRGWRIQFENRSIVHALLQYHRRIGLKCAWRSVDVKKWQPNKHNQGNDKFRVSDSVIRIENCQNEMTVDHTRHLFRRFDLTQDGPSVTEIECQGKSPSKLFLVRFKDPSWARAAVRELQGIKVHSKKLRLAQFPRQIL